VADLDQDGSVVVDGRPLRFDATGVSAKLVRLRRHREHLKTKPTTCPGCVTAGPPRPTRP
jgi:hypothetical protein